VNIFYLSTDAARAAVAQCDQHVVKMILESAQLLSTAHHEIDGASPAYKPTHKNHPSAVWVRQSRLHYAWLWNHMRHLGIEYQKRFGKVHKTIQQYSQVLQTPPVGLLGSTFDHPPQCMPDECKRDCAVEAYQVYYHAKATDWASKGRPMRFFGQPYFEEIYK